MSLIQNQDFKENDYVLVRTSYNFNDGWYTEICKCISSIDNINNINVINYVGTRYYIPTTQIVEKVNFYPVIKYKIGDTVKALINYYNSKPSYIYCKILNIDVFGESVAYIVEEFNELQQKYRVDARNIICRIYSKPPRYELGIHVSYKYYVHNPNYYDYETKHGIIINIHPSYDSVKYIIKFDDGTSAECDEKRITRYVPPAPKKNKYNSLEYLEREEKILLEKLEQIREKKVNLS